MIALRSKKSEDKIRLTNLLSFRRAFIWIFIEIEGEIEILLWQTEKVFLSGLMFRMN